MTREYSEHLKSAEWAQRRVRRLARSGHQCEACGCRERLHVHHLTYARIYNEDIDDLMTLCQLHHSLAEQLVEGRDLSRNGDPQDLARKTLRLLGVDSRFASPRKKFAVKRKNTKGHHSAMELIRTLNRREFEDYVKTSYKGKVSPRKILIAALARYDKFHSRGAVMKPQPGRRGAFS